MRALLLVPAIAACCGVTPAAEPRTPSAPAAPLPPIFAPTALPRKSPPARSSKAPTGIPAARAISPEMAAKLSAVATRAAPPASAAGASSEAARTGGDAATDAVQLEPYVVEEEKLPEFKERHLLTPKGKIDLAHKRHPGLNLGGLPLFNDGPALAIIEDEFAKERRKELAELQGVLEIGKKSAPPAVQRKIDETRMRNNEWSSQSGTPFRGPN